MALVFLHQPASRCNHNGCYPDILQGPRASCSGQSWMESSHKGIRSPRHRFFHSSSYLPLAGSAMGWDQVRVEFLADNPSVLLLRCPDCHLHCHPVLETGDCHHPSNDDEEEIHVVCSYVLILHGLFLPFADLLPPYLVSSSQRCFSCQIWNHELAHGPFAGSCLYHQWYRCYPCRIL